MILKPLKKQVGFNIINYKPNPNPNPNPNQCSVDYCI